MPLFYCVSSNFAPIAVTSANRTLPTWRKRGQDIHWQIKQWFSDLDPLCFFFMIWSGNLHPALPTWPFSLPLTGSQQGDIVNWLYNKEKRIMHTCWYSVLFFSCPSVCARWFEVHMDLTVSFYCLLQLSSPFMGEKKMSMCRFTALCVSQFKMLQCLES